MTVLPVTFEEIQKFLNEQENIITRNIKNDNELRIMIKKNKINIKDEEIENIIRKINKEMKRKYRMIWFTRQLRFQIIQQIIKLENDKKINKIEKIDNINNILKLFQINNNLIKDNEFNDKDKILKLIEEIPDSNLLKTNNLELIEKYDNLRDKLIKDIKRRNKLIKNVNKLKEINENVEIIKKEIKNNQNNKSNQGIIREETDKLNYLLELQK